MRMNRLATSIAVATAATFIVGIDAGRAATIVNGSFEDTTNFVGNSDDTMVLGVGSTAMPGWTVVNGGVAWIGPSNTFGLTASAGSYFLDLTDYRDSIPYGGVSQTTIATNIGSTYALNFDLGSDSRYGLPDGITVTADTTAPTSQTFTSTNNGSQQNLWEAELFTFIATGTSTSITLDGQTANQKYIGLDNVSISEIAGAPTVPLPAALPLFAGGLGMIGLLAARKRRRISGLPA